MCTCSWGYIFLYCPAVLYRSAGDRLDKVGTSGGREEVEEVEEEVEEVEEEASSGEIEPPAQLHLSSFRSAAGLSGVVKVTLNPSFSAGWGRGGRWEGEGLVGM